LDYYGLLAGMKKSGKNLISACPIHKGSNPRQFSVDPEKNIFNCFGDCKSGGNVLDFVAKMEGVSLREAGLLIKDKILNGICLDAKEPDTKTVKAEKEEPPADKVTVNPPLTFQLKNLKTDHSFFSEQNIEPETVKHFGLGFCAKGMMKGRIVIPIHNELGELVAYCGRAVDKKQIKSEGKYKLPPKFVKSEVLYNLNLQKKDEDTFILVESFLSVFRLYQAGYSNVLALMGSSLSEAQEKMINQRLTPEGKVIMLFDDDEAGRACARDSLKRLGSKLFVKIPDISHYGKKPHHLNSDQIKLSLNLTL